MLSLPQLLNWQTAAIAAGVVIPALLILYFLKLRRQPVSIGSTLLWKKAIQDLQVNSPFQRLRRNLLLLLQLLVLLALLFALARPVSEGQPVAGAKTVILIDRSASMSAEDGVDGVSRLRDAKDRAKDLVDTMGRGDQAMVIAFDDSASVVQTFTGDAALLRSAIDDITPSDRPTRLKNAYALANANMAVDFDAIDQDELEQAEVFLYSDGRVPASDIAELSLRGKINYERIGTTNTRNLGLVAASVKRNYERPTQAQVFARVGNFGPEMETAAVRVSVATINEDDPSATLEFRNVGTVPVEVTIPPARWTDEEWKAVTQEVDPKAYEDSQQALRDAVRRDSVDISLELPRAAVVRIELVEADDYSQVVEDGLDADDIAFVAVPPPEPLRALLVTSGNFFLELLIQTQSLEEPRIIVPSEYEALLASGEADDFDVTIFDGYSPPTLPPAGTYVFSGVLPPESATEVRPVTNEEGLALYYDGNAVLDWEREHPMMLGLLLNRVYASTGQLLSIPIGTEMLIEGDRGPMLLLERNGPRTNLIFSFDLRESNWPLQTTFPYFCAQMFQYLAAGEDVRVRESVRPGEVVGVPRNLVDRADLEEDARVTLEGPFGIADGRRDERSFPVTTGGVSLGPLQKIGAYRTKPSIPQFEWLAVSLLDETESNLLTAYTDPGNLSNEDIVAVARSDAEEESSRVRNIEWWWWLVAIAAGVLMIEWIIYTRRVNV